MVSRNAIENVMKYPGTFFSPVEYDVASAFLTGFDVATHGGLLVGFHEWLLPRVGGGDNQYWTELVLYLLFPGAPSPREHLARCKDQEQLVRSLFSLLEEFWLERDELHGLRGIYSRCHEWLQKQEE
jgi:hypothetical protein